MGRGENSLIESEIENTIRKSQEVENYINYLKDSAVDMEKVFEELNHLDNEPNWKELPEFDQIEAQQFISPGVKGGIEGLDQVVAMKLLQLNYDGDFFKYRHWYNGALSLIEHPEKTVPGMTEAGAMIADHIDQGNKIAVFCDYDVDGTTSGEIFRRGVEPYGADLHYGYADAQRGFGLTDDFVMEASEQGAKLLITLDCGSSQARQIELANSLGMKTIVLDHHSADENPATFHLNPKLSNPETSENTASQLSWKLAASVQIAEEGYSRPEHKEHALQLAGMGCVADMGSVLLPENRAFFWGANEHVVPGVRYLASQLEEDPEIPGACIRTQACMNLPKRTSLVSAKDIGDLLAAGSEEEAKPIADKLLEKYENVKPVKKEMQEKALAKVGKADWDHPDGIKRPNPDKYFSSVTLEDYEEYSGYTGPIASAVSRATAKPAVIFSHKGKDEHGQDIYKFSTRSERGVKSSVRIGDLIENGDMKRACTIKHKNESGDTVETPVVGGHENVVSGSCTKENLSRVKEVMETWAAEKDGKNKNRFFAEKWRGPDAYPIERRVSAERLSSIEKQASKLFPYSNIRQASRPKRSKNDERKLQSHRPIELSVMGSLSDLVPDEDDSRYMDGSLVLATGERRKIKYPVDAKQPVGQMCEWIISVRGDNSPYFLRKFFNPVTGETQ